jgi:putative permease
MIKFFQEWYRRYFSDPQAVLLAVFLLLSFGTVIVMGKILAPVIAAIVIAYLLEGLIQQLERLGIPRSLAVTGVFLLFTAALIFLVGGLLPLLSRQLTEFFQQLPDLINDGQQILLRLPEHYPEFFTVEQVQELIMVIRRGITELWQSVLSLSLASIPAIILILVYLVVGPFLVFFFLKDKVPIIDWLTTNFLPHDRALLTRVWQEMDMQMGNYVRGKFSEVLLVGIITYIVFGLMGLNYAPLLSVLTGLSVVVPYIGSTAVTVPVAFAAYVQWGWSAELGWVIAVYFIIHAIDGNIVVPLLFSEVVHLHPVAIVVAILVFGGWWGFWGVFFAIPLATLVQALIQVWPRTAGVESSKTVE